MTSQSGEASGCARTRDQVVAAICEQISEGGVIEDGCGADRPADFPNWRTFYKWLLKDPETKKSYDEAVQARLLKFVDSTFKIANDGSNDWMEKLNEKGELYDMSDAPFGEKLVPSDTTDATAVAARRLLQAALDKLNPAGGIIDDGDGTGRHANKAKKQKDKPSTD